LDQVPVHALPVAPEQEGEQVNMDPENILDAYPDLDRMFRDYRKRYKNGILSLSDYKKAIQAIEQEAKRRKAARK